MTDLLVRMPNWLGDVVMATSALEALHRTGKYSLRLLIRPPWNELFAADPRITEVLLCKDRVPDLWTTAAMLRQRRFDLVVDFTHSIRSRILFALSGIPHIHREPLPAMSDSALSTHHSSLITSHQITRYLSVIRDLAGPSGDVPWPPSLTIPPLNKPNNEGPTPNGEILLFPAAAYGPAKEWSVERHADLLNRMLARNWPVRLVGVERDIPFLEAIRSHSVLSTHHLELTVGLPLPDLMRLISSCQAVISCDSGAAHLAAALGKPVLVLFFSTDPRQTAPLGAAVHVMAAEVPCRPCFLRTCLIGYLCRDAMTPAQVMTQLEDILDVPGVPARKNN